MERAEAAGLAVGRVLAVITGSVSGLRRARMFHPEGVVYEGRISVCAVTAELRVVAQRLEGPALLRLSSAWWRRRQWPDVLGVAMRFHSGLADPLEPEPSDQDLLFATVRFPWTTPFAPLATRFSSFLWNHYHAVSPFFVNGLGRVKVRLRSPRLANPGNLRREEHLRRLLLEGRANFVLEVRRLSDWAPLRRWEPLVEVTLLAPVQIDQAALRFSPFRAGRGFSPVGFVHALRVATYAASQAARPRTS